MKPNCYAKWFTRTVWIGILVNLSFAGPGTVHTAGRSRPRLASVGWRRKPAFGSRNAGMLLIVLSVFHAAVASDPLGTVAFARRARRGSVNRCRVLAVIWPGVLRLPGVLWGFFATDLRRWASSAAFCCGALAVDPPRHRSRGGGVSTDRALWLDHPPARRNRHTLVRSCGRRYSVRSVPAGCVANYEPNNLYHALNDVPDAERNRVVEVPDAGEPHPLPEWNPSYRDSRSPDGSFNDLSEPAMGMTGMRFGRNVPLADGHPTVPWKVIRRRSCPRGIPAAVRHHRAGEPTPACQRTRPRRTGLQSRRRR